MNVYIQFRDELDSIIKEIQNSFHVFFQGKQISLSAYRKQIDELLNRINGLLKLDRNIFNELDETKIENKEKFQALLSRYTANVNDSIEMIFSFMKVDDFGKLRDNEALRRYQQAYALERINKAFEEKNITVCTVHCAESLVYVLYKFKNFFQRCNTELNHNTEFTFVYENEVTPEKIEALQKQLSNIKTNEEKISFLINEKANYLQNISPRTLEVSGSVHSKFPPGAELFWDRYLQIEIDKLERIKDLSNNRSNEYSHREYILANKFKSKVNIEKEKTPSEWEKERGANAKNNYYTLHKKSKDYREPTLKELKNVIQLLEGFPEAQKIAINNKEQAEKLIDF